MEIVVVTDQISLGTEINKNISSITSSSSSSKHSKNVLADFNPLSADDEYTQHDIVVTLDSCRTAPDTVKIMKKL